jgi:hypothetical protein
MFKILTTTQLRGTVCRRAYPNRPLLRLNGADLAHGFTCEVTTLSPSDRELELAVAALGSLLPQHLQAKGRIPDRRPNDTSVVTWISIGEIKILLGADLEEHGDTARGWSAIISNKQRPGGKATIFKVPHHGSENGHHRDTWIELLTEHPIALVTPWNRGGGLPTASDVARVTGLAPGSFVTTSAARGAAVPKRSVAVEKTIRETVGRLRSSQPRPGRITLRSNITPPYKIWSIDLQDGACALGDLRNGFQ